MTWQWWIGTLIIVIGLVWWGYCGGRLRGYRIIMKQKEVIKRLREEANTLTEGLLTYWAMTPEGKEWISLQKTLDVIRGNQPPSMTPEFIKRCFDAGHDVVTRIAKERPETEYHGDGQQEVR